MKIIYSLLLLLLSVCFCDVLNSAARNQVLVDHNNARANVNPPAASPLSDLNYSSSAENIASNYANQCVYAHSSGTGLGENLFAGSGDRTGDLVTLMMQADGGWESEDQFYDLDTNSCTPGEQCGHYTQMIWAHSSYPTFEVGCGYRYCTTNSPFGANFPTWTYVVCNYNGPGNYIGLLPYVRAEQGQASPSNTQTPAPSSSSVPSQSRTPSPSSSSAPSQSRTPSPSSSSAPSQSRTPSPSSSSAPSQSNSPVPSSSSASSQSNTPTPSSSSASSQSNTPAPSETSSTSVSPTSSLPPEVSPSTTSTTSISASNTPTSAPSQSNTPAASPSAAESSTPAASPSAAESSTPTAAPSESNTPTPSQSSFPSPTSSPCNILCGIVCCGVNEICDPTNICICSPGFELIGGVCIATTGGNTPDYSNDFEQVFPPSTNNEAFIFLSDPPALKLNNAGPHIVRWSKTEAVMDKYTSKHFVSTDVPSGSIYIATRHNQGGGRENDRVEWRIHNVGSSANLEFCVVFYGNDYCGGSFTIDFPAPVTIETEMTFDDSNQNILFKIQLQGSLSYFTGYINEYYYPLLGAISYYLSPPSGAFPILSNTKLATSTTLTVSLSECIDDTEWATMFYDLTGADPDTTSVNIRDAATNANCAKSLSTGKALVSGFTFVVTSTSVPSSALGNVFVNSVGSPAASALGITSATTIPGSAGASIAGFQTSSALVPTTALIPGAGGSVGGGAAAGGGGAAASNGAGLSGAEIGGIVVGSVAGSMLALGVVSIVVGTVVVGAIVLSSGEDDNQANDSENKRRSVRKTIRGFFGGVDVMNDPKGHQSISARSPAF